MKSGSLPRKAKVLFAFAILLIVAGISFSIWHISGTNERNDIRSNGQRTTGIAQSRSEIRYQTPAGEFLGEPIIGTQQGTLTRYDSVYIYYDKNNPQVFVLEQSESPYNITMWIVVAKLLGAAFVFTLLGYRNTQKNRRESPLVDMR